MNHGAAALSIKRRAPSMDANPNIPRSAQPAAAPRGTAGAMSLSWQQVAPGAPLRDEGDDLTVLLPAAGAAVTVSLASRLGGVRRAVVADPAVCIVPPRARLESTAERRSDLLVIAFDGAGWSEQMREALGLAAEIRECKVAATDAFIRRIADLLCNLPPSHDGAGSAWVDALAEDFAIHLATRYGRPDIFDETVQWVTTGGPPKQKEALAEFRRRAELGQIPQRALGAERVAQFIDGEYAVHRF